MGKDRENEISSIMNRQDYPSLIERCEPLVALHGCLELWVVVKRITADNKGLRCFLGSGDCLAVG